MGGRGGAGERSAGRSIGPHGVALQSGGEENAAAQVGFRTAVCRMIAPRRKSLPCVLESPWHSVRAWSQPRWLSGPARLPWAGLGSRTGSSTARLRPSRGRDRARKPRSIATSRRPIRRSGSRSLRRGPAKATLPKAQSPAVKAVTPPDTTPVVGATGIGRFRVSSSQPSRPVGDGQRARSRGRTGTPTSRSTRPAQGEFGMAYGARALGPRSVRSSRRSHDLPGRTGKPFTGRRDTGARIDNDGEVREMVCHER